MDWVTIATLPGVQVTVAGGFGGIARWLFVIIMDRKMALRQAIATIMLGAILGFFVSPHIASQGLLDLFGVSADPDKLPTFNAFVLGIVAVTAVGFVIDFWANRTKKLIEDAAIPPDVPKPNSGANG